MPESGSFQASETERYDHRDMLRRALAELGRSQREIVVLRYWEDLSVAEVADVLNLSTGTVKSQSARGLERLREQLSTSGAATKGNPR
jgi:RNA polymerase sigma factor (sigma-70 family)